MKDQKEESEKKTIDRVAIAISLKQVSFLS